MLRTLSSAQAAIAPVDDVLRAFGVDIRHGLSSLDVTERVRVHGANELETEEPEPVWKKFIEKLKEPMIALLLASAGVSLLTGQYDDAISISLAVIIVITVACVQEYKSDQSLAALSRLAPPHCHVLRDGRVMDIEASGAVPGDVVVFAGGDRVPADVRIIEAVELAIDESSLTGETEPSEKTTSPSVLSGSSAGGGGGAGAVPLDSATSPSNNASSSSAAAAALVGITMEVPVAERHCIAYMGTLVRTGRGRGVVVATGMATELGRVMALMDSAEDRKSPLQVKMDELAKKLSIISFAAIGVIFVIGLIYHKGWLDMFTIGVSLAVAAIPEGLPIVVAVTLALGVQRMAAKNAVVKKLPAVEALGCASVVCVDKTGTLTRNEMTVVEAFSLVPPVLLNNNVTTTTAASAGGAGGSESGNGPAAVVLSGGGGGGQGGAISELLSYENIRDRLGRGIGSRILFHGLGYDTQGGWAEYATPHVPSIFGGADSMSSSSSSSSSLHNSKNTGALSSISAPHVGLLMEAASVCNNAHLVQLPAQSSASSGFSSTSATPSSASSVSSTAAASTVLMGQPTEGALLAAATKVGLRHARDQWVRTHEIPFNSDSKWMAVRARPATAADAAVAGLTPAETISSSGGESFMPFGGSASNNSNNNNNTLNGSFGGHGYGASSSAAYGYGMGGVLGGSQNYNNSNSNYNGFGHGHGPSNVTSGGVSSGAIAVPGEFYFIKGSVDAVLALCDGCLAPQGSANGNIAAAALLLGGSPVVASALNASSLPFTVAPMSVTSHASVLAAAETMAREGLRVLALAKGDRIPSNARFSGGVTTTTSRGRTGSSSEAASFTSGWNSSSSTSSSSSSSSSSISSNSSSAPTTSTGMVFLGLVGLHDPPREGALGTVRALRNGGVRVCMITGDGEATALAIATQLGLIDESPVPLQDMGEEATSSSTTLLASSANHNTGIGLELGANHEVAIAPLASAGYAISGAEVDAMSEDALSARVASAVVFYRTTPRHKMKIVHAFQRRGLVVAMTGDGVNDAPALKVADIGVAMGGSGATDVAKEAADMVLMDDNFATIIGAIEEGKGIFANIRNFVRFQLSTSVAALTLVTIATLLGLPNPLNAMQILWINIIMDGPPAQSLGVEPVDPAVMRRPPRRSDEPIITSSLLKRVLAAAAVIVIGTLYVFVSEAGDGTASSVRRDTTMTFTTFVMFDMFNAMSCRSADLSVFSLGFMSNKFFLAAVGGSLLGQWAVVYVPPLQAVFQTEAISFMDWVYICLIASSVMWMEEGIKAYGRAQERYRSSNNGGGNNNSSSNINSSSGGGSGNSSSGSNSTGSSNGSSAELSILSFLARSGEYIVSLRWLGKLGRMLHARFRGLRGQRSDSGDSLPILSEGSTSSNASSGSVIVSSV